MDDFSSQNIDSVNGSASSDTAEQVNGRADSVHLDPDTGRVVEHDDDLPRAVLDAGAVVFGQVTAASDFEKPCETVERVEESLVRLQEICHAAIEDNVAHDELHAMSKESIAVLTYLEVIERVLQSVALANARGAK